MVQNTMRMNNNPEKNKLELDLKLKDGDDIPFILCTPMKNENDDAAQDTTTTDEAAGSPKLKTFPLNPCRSSCHCASCCDKKVVGPTANAEILSESSLIGIGKDSANESLDCNTLHSSPRSSPAPILQSRFDVMVTPRVINLLKIRPRRSASQEEEQHQEGDDDDKKSASLTAGPLFPILGRRYNHHLQQQHLQHPVIRRPIPHHRR
jgi:hypothetical protein